MSASVSGGDAAAAVVIAMIFFFFFFAVDFFCVCSSIIGCFKEREFWFCSHLRGEHPGHFG